MDDLPQNWKLLHQSKTCLLLSISFNNGPVTTFAKIPRTLEHIFSYGFLTSDKVNFCSLLYALCTFSKTFLIFLWWKKCNLTYLKYYICQTLSKSKMHHSNHFFITSSDKTFTRKISMVVLAALSIISLISKNIVLGFHHSVKMFDMTSQLFSYNRHSDKCLSELRLSHILIINL